MDFNNTAIILCEDDKSALDLYNILLAINPINDVCYFPAHDSLPFSDEKSSNEILLERSFQLINLKKRKIIIISCNNLLKKFSTNSLKDHFFTLSVNQTIDIKKILELLVSFNHINNPNVYNRCEFSHRGDILDIYNHNSNPYLISFFDNTIESIKEFSPQTQLTNKILLDTVTIVNPEFENSINDISGISLLKYLNNHELFCFNRSDIVLFDRIDFYQSIYDKTELDQPYSSYFLNKSDLSHHSFQNIQSSTPILSSTKNSLSMEYLKKQSKMIFLHQGYNSSDLQREYLEKVKIEPSIEKLINFEKSTISKNYELENSIHFNLY